MTKFLSRAMTAALFAWACVACSSSDDNPPDDSSADAKYSAVERDYVLYFLDRNPVVATYLGGAALDAKLANVDGRLRDHSASALAAEDQALGGFKQRLEALDRNALSAAHQIDRDVALAQIEFQLHLHQVRKYQERSLDTYLDEPFRGVDWQLQGMTDAGNGKYGTEAEWQRVIERVGAVRAYLQRAQDQLRAGIASGNTADWRMLRINGIDSAVADAEYFRKTLPDIAAERIGGAQRDALLNAVRNASAEAAAAYEALHQFVASEFFVEVKKDVVEKAGLKAAFQADRYALGEAEYNWALRNNLRLTKPAAQLYEEAQAVIESTQREMVQLSRIIGQERNLALPVDDMEVVRAVFGELSKKAPKNDDEMVAWYRQAGERLVDYARKTGLFEMPNEYKLDVTVTPPPLQGSISGAAYYPAPPFKESGVGRFYVSPTKNNPVSLARNNASALAYLAAHEGFPGHDWHYKVMTQYRNDIARVRWLTPGAVEDSSSMWEDSGAAEGWALYSEALMAEPQPNYEHGFYSSDERLYQLKGKLTRDVRVRIDTGIHLGRLSFEAAQDLFSQVVDFLPGPCQGATDETKKASCDDAFGAIFRYSKWPTQAITYRLGKEAILDLRTEAKARAGDRFSATEFHVRFMKQGTIPPGYFREQFLSGF
ncbi:DUF885 domain-containing protein [Pendulispora rubella]|uniref:DUF885 domain-containing protein n=1 Tax=Pendulispora rubella TaxID=2741070 RepID=A0ABZ2L6F7_9BACT